MTFTTDRPGNVCDKVGLLSTLKTAKLKEKRVKPEAEDVLPNINRTQAATWAEKFRFCP